jgi:uncharacterized protein with von Willebrand factor type A (vWA) domain
MTHQFSLFGFQKPTSKVPISAERIAEAKAELAKGKNGDTRKVIEVLRDLNDKLENYQRRIK